MSGSGTCRATGGTGVRRRKEGGPVRATEAEGEGPPPPPVSREVPSDFWVRPFAPHSFAPPTALALAGRRLGPLAPDAQPRVQVLGARGAIRRGKLFR